MLRLSSNDVRQTEASNTRILFCTCCHPTDSYSYWYLLIPTLTSETCSSSTWIIRGRTSSTIGPLRSVQSNFLVLTSTRVTQQRHDPWYSYTCLVVYTICHCCHTCCGKLIAFLQNKLGYWSVTRPFLSMRRGGNTRLGVIIILWPGLSVVQASS